MAEDLLTPVHPLASFAPAFAALSRELSPLLLVGPEPDAAMIDLRLAPVGAAPGAVAEVLRAPLPTAPGSWRAVDGGRAHRLGPDQWLVTLDAPDGLGATGATEDVLGAALRPHGGAATDVSAGRTALRLGGEGARELLAFGCSLDLRPAATPPGWCAQTVIWQAAVLLAADADGFLLFVRTSFAAHLATRLLDAAQELRDDPSLPLT